MKTLSMLICLSFFWSSIYPSSASAFDKQTSDIYALSYLSSVQDGNIKSLFKEYVTADSKLKKMLFLRKIKEQISSVEGTSLYEAGLQYIDQQSNIYPEDVYHIAYSLQYQWEAKYGHLIQAEQFRAKKTATEIGLFIGVSALGISLLTKPTNTPKYFKILRHFLPLASVTTASQLSFDSAGKYPPAPAQLMHLGITDTAAYDISKEDIAKEISLLTLNIGTAAASYEIMKALYFIRAANAASTPLKVNIAFLIASALIGLAAEDIANVIIDNNNKMQLRSEILSLRNEIADAVKNNEREQLVNAADKLTSLVIAKANQDTKPYYEEMQSFQNNILNQNNSLLASNEAAKEKWRAFKLKMQRLIYNSKAYYITSEVSLHGALTLLESKASYSDVIALPEYARPVAGKIWSKSNLKSIPIRDLAKQTRKEQLERIQQNAITETSDEGIALLVETGLFLRSFENPLLDEQADILLSTFQRQVMYIYTFANFLPKVSNWREYE